MNEMNFNWDDLRLFLAVARGGGLAAATTSTGKSAPTLGRRILALERRLGCELFRRMARGYELTDEGRELLAKAAALEDRIVPIIERGSGRTFPVIKISAGTWVTHALAGATTELIGGDRIGLRFVAANEVVDIGRREALIGVRNKRPEGVGLAMRRVGRVRFAIYATQRSVRTWARVIGSTPSAMWVKENSRHAAAIEVTDPRNALDMTLSGETRAVLPTFIGSRFKALMQLSMPLEELDHDQWLVIHHDDRHIPEVRRVIDRTYAVLERRCATR